MQKELAVGNKAPNFTLPRDGGDTLSLKDFKGQNIVLYFYPKDDTPGCTAESCDFRDNFKQFQKLNAQIIGISKDSIARHEKFIAKYDLPFPLVSDEEGDVCEAYGTWVEKSMYGRKYMGIDRSTFLIDGNGKIAAIWRKVKVKDHVKEVEKAIKALEA
jgi:peroxiredoxin Q/BCP